MIEFILTSTILWHIDLLPLESLLIVIEFDNKNTFGRNDIIIGKQYIKDLKWYICKIIQYVNKVKVLYLYTRYRLSFSHFDTLSTLIECQTKLVLYTFI